MSANSIKRRTSFLGALVFAGAVAVVCLVPQVGMSSMRHAAMVQPAKPAKLLPSQAPVFPLKVGPTKRYLVDSKGRPFLIVGDSPQSLITNLSVTEANSYLADREAAGFNSVWINLLCDTYTGGNAEGTTYDGIAPFTTPGDLSTPNPAYFARADQMISLAAEHHITVFLDPIETGGWLDVLEQNGVTAAYDYGLYLGQRYSHFSNIVWLSGNDFQTWEDSQDDDVVLAVADGIKAADPKALQTVELNYLASTSLDDPQWANIVGLNAVYTYYPTYGEVLYAYDNPDRAPAFLIEASYEGEHDYTGPSTLRRQEYWTMLSGGAGQFYGNTYTWPFLNGWQSHLDTIGSRQITYFTNFFSGLRWYDLVPDAKHELVVSGYGDYAPWSDINSSDYVTDARTRSGSLAVAYLPAGQPIEVNLKDMAGPRVGAEWFDPTNGKYRTVKGSPFVRRGRRRFTVPSKNSEGNRDWLLVLTATKPPAKAGRVVLR